MKRAPDPTESFPFVFISPPTAREVFQIINHVIGTGAAAPDSFTAETIKLLESGDSDTWKGVLEDLDAAEVGYAYSLLLPKFPHLSSLPDGLTPTE